MGLKIFYVFGKIWVDTVDQDFYVDVVDQCFCADTVVQWCCAGIADWNFCWCVDAYLVYSDGGIYLKVPFDNRFNN